MKEDIWGGSGGSLLGTTLPAIGKRAPRTPDTLALLRLTIKKVVGISAPDPVFVDRAPNRGERGRVGGVPQEAEPREESCWVVSPRSNSS